MWKESWLAGVMGIVHVMAKLLVLWWSRLLPHSGLDLKLVATQFSDSDQCPSTYSGQMPLASSLSDLVKPGDSHPDCSWGLNPTRQKVIFSSVHQTYGNTAVWHCLVIHTQHQPWYKQDLCHNYSVLETVWVSGVSPADWNPMKFHLHFL